jgi:PAS domain S-box-containing protein
LAALRPVPLLVKVGQPELSRLRTVPATPSLAVLESMLIEQRLMHFAIEAARDRIVIADAQTTDMPIVYSNEAFSRMTGFEPDEVIGRNWRFLQAQDKDQAGITTLRGAMAASRGCLVTLRNYCKEGTLFWNELRISPLPDNYGRVTHYSDVQKDVAVRVRAVEQLAAANARLALVNDNASQFVYRDPVIDAFSREHFDYSLKRDWQLWQRHGLPVGCLLIALQPQRAGQRHSSTNGFEGELKRVARTASRSFRRGADMVARFSSTELIVLGANVDGSAARPP